MTLKATINQVDFEQHFDGDANGLRDESYELARWCDVVFDRLDGKRTHESTHDFPPEGRAGNQIVHSWEIILNAIDTKNSLALRSGGLQMGFALTWAFQHQNHNTGEWLAGIDWELELAEDPDISHEEAKELSGNLRNSLNAMLKTVTDTYNTYQPTNGLDQTTGDTDQQIVKMFTELTSNHITSNSDDWQEQLTAYIAGAARLACFRGYNY